MTEAVKFEVSGASNIVAKLESVTFDVRRKGGRFAGGKAAKIIEQAARFNAAALDDPETRESIAANLTSQFNNRLFKRTGDVGFRIGIRGGAKQDAAKGKAGPGGDTWYWRLLEFGTVKAPAQEFMQKAMASSMSAAADEFFRQYDRALDRAIKRANKAAK